MRRSLYAAAALLQGANALLATPPRRPETRLRNLNDHIDVLQGQFEASPVDGLPDWVQTTLEQQGLNVLTFDEGNASLLFANILVIALASYVGKQTGNADTMEIADGMRRERRRRGRMDVEKALPGEDDVRGWFADDQDCLLYTSDAADDYSSFVLVDDDGKLLRKGTPQPPLPAKSQRQMNYRVVQGSKYAVAADGDPAE